MSFINTPNGTPYLEVIDDGELVKIRPCQYEDKFWLTIDKKSVPFLINALKEVNEKCS